MTRATEVQGMGVRNCVRGERTVQTLPQRVRVRDKPFWKWLLNLVSQKNVYAEAGTACLTGKVGKLGLLLSVSY